MATELYVILNSWLPEFWVNGQPQLIPGLVFLVGCLEKANRCNSSSLVTFSFYYQLYMSSVIKTSYQVTQAAFSVCLHLPISGEAQSLLCLLCGQGPSCLVSQYAGTLKELSSTRVGMEGKAVSFLVQNCADLPWEWPCWLPMWWLNLGLCTFLFRDQCVASMKVNNGCAFNSILLETSLSFFISGDSAIYPSFNIPGPIFSFMSYLLFILNTT